ncbi:MAG: hypothetical protein ABJK20_09075 [Halieaceae bacterium]
MKSAADEWEFKLSPLFLWGISLDADATIGTETVPLDLSFEDDVIENMDTVFTFHFEAKNDDLIFFAEYQYVKLDPSLSIGAVDADVEFENTAIELGAGWEFFRSERIDWEMLLGLRYLDQDVDVDGTLSLPEPPNGPGALPLAVAGGDDWYHPFLGIRGDYRLGSRWSLLGRGDYGYSDSDNSLLNLSVMFDYRFKQWGSAFIGWRYQDVDYDSGAGSDRYAFDGIQQGPLMGLTLYW